MTIYLSLLVALVGLVVYLIASGATREAAKELAGLAFFAGLLVFLWCFCTGGHAVSFLR